MLLYRNDADGNRERVPDTDALARMLHIAPNPELTAQECYEAIAGHTLLWGNAYGYVLRDGRGQPEELWPLRPDAMQVVLIDTNGKLHDPEHVNPDTLRGLRRAYLYQLPNGEYRALPRENILHVRALATNGLVGLSPITVARNAVALEQAATEHGGRFFSNNARPGGILTTQGALAEPVRKRLKDNWEAAHAGLEKAHRVALMEGGVSWQSIGMNNDDAQFVETRRFQIGEIARLYRIPPHLVGDVAGSTSWGTGIEQQTLGFLTYTLRPWLERIEQAIDRDLGFGRGSGRLRDQGLICEFLVEGLLRGDTKSRMEAYEIMIRNRIVTPNQVAKMENLPPLPGGDEPFIPLNMGVPGAAAPSANGNGNRHVEHIA